MYYENEKKKIIKDLKRLVNKIKSTQNILIDNENQKEISTYVKIGILVRVVKYEMFVRNISIYNHSV